MRYKRSVMGLAVGLLLLHSTQVLAVAAPPNSPRSARDSPPSAPPASALGLIRDLRLTVLARRSLRQQPPIQGVFVEVRGGVARVWGKVSSSETTRQVVARLEAVSGIHEVRSELSSADLRERAVVADLTVPARVPTKVVVQAHKPDETVELPRKKPRELLQTVGGEGVKAVRPGDLPTFVASPTRPATGAILLPPSRVSGRQGQTENQTIRRPPTTRTLSDAVVRIKASNERFANIPVVVRDRVIVVRRSGAADEDITALAQQLRLLPGVEDVIRDD